MGVYRSPKLRYPAKYAAVDPDATRFIPLGMEKPLFTLKNPGIISIPLGFLAVLLGSLLFRDKRSEALWPEVYARQNTGILASKAASR